MAGKFREMTLDPIPVRAELVEALSWFFVPSSETAGRKVQPFDKLRANGVREDR